MIVRMRNIKLLDESHEERLHLDDTAKKPISVPPERVIRQMINSREPPPDTTPNTSGERRAERIKYQYSTSPLKNNG